jgi:hypothetical protein
MDQERDDVPGPFNFALGLMSRRGSEGGLFTRHRLESRLGKPMFTCRAPARAAESPKLSLPGAAPGRRANRKS